MPKGKPICLELKQMVVDAFLEGRRLVDISRQFILPKYTVTKIISRYNARGHVETMPKSGRPKKLQFGWIGESKGYAKKIHGCQDQE